MSLVGVVVDDRLPILFEARDAVLSRSAHQRLDDFLAQTRIGANDLARSTAQVVGVGLLRRLLVHHVGLNSWHQQRAPSSLKDLIGSVLGLIALLLRRGLT